MKITEYPAAEGLVKDDLLLIDGPQGTRNILAGLFSTALLGLMNSKDIMQNVDLRQLEQASIGSLTADSKILVSGSDGISEAIGFTDAFWEMVDILSDGSSEGYKISLKRSLWRGKDIGEYPTDEQLASIKDGSFKGLFLGDYWRNGGVIWRIVDFDYWVNSGDTPCYTHHLVIMPDDQLYTHNMAATNTTAGAYATARSTVISQAQNMARDAFGDHVLVHREYFANAVTNGYPSAGSWYDSDVDIPNEVMIYGCHFFAPMGNGTTVAHNYTIDKTQLAGMRANPVFINPFRRWYWLRDVVSATSFAYVNGYGVASCYDASYVCGVRPAFGITG